MIKAVAGAAVILFAAATAVSAVAQNSPWPTWGDGLTTSFFLRRQRPPPELPSLGDAVAAARGQTCAGTARGAGILGDTLLFRNPGYFRALVPDFRRTLAAAYVSSDPVAAAGLLKPYASALPVTAYAAALVSLDISIKSGRDPATLSAAIERLTHLSATAAIPASDAAYFRGLAELSAGRLDRAHAAALSASEIEPDFFNAHLLRIGVLLQHSASTVRRSKSCLMALANLIDALTRLTELAPCPQQATYVDVFFDTNPQIPRDGPLVLLTRAHLAALAFNRPAVLALQRRMTGDATSESRLPGICRSMIVEQIADVLNRVPARDPNAAK